MIMKRATRYTATMINGVITTGFERG